MTYKRISFNSIKQNDELAKQVLQAQSGLLMNLMFIFTILLASLFLAACSGTRHLPPGEKLYTGAVIKLESKDDVSKKKKRFVKAVAENALRPKPNSTFLSMRPKLWLFMAAGTDPKSKFRKRLQKMGEPPVLISGAKPGVTSAIIDAKLYNIGVFKSLTGFETLEKKRTAKLIYNCQIHKPYTIEKLKYAISDNSINHIIVSDKENALIKQGDDYNLDILKNERMRLDALLKDNGYFFFSPDFLLFKVDTSALNKNATLTLTLTENIPNNALIVYRINNVYIDQKYSLNDEAENIIKDTFKIEDNIFIGKESQMDIRPNVILKSVFLRKSDVYTRKNHNITLNRLMAMGNFKFVSLKFSDSNTSTSGLLDVTLLMTPMPKYTFRAEIDIVSKSNNYTGPRMNVSVLNRNTFSGAELLNVNIAGSFEAQLSGANKNLFSYSYNPQVELIFPVFLLPFKVKTSSYFIPKTRFSLAYNFLNRGNYFNMRTLQFIYGYKWKEEIRKEHELNPFDISYTSVTNKSAAFNALLDANPFLKKSYEEQFIAGGSYSYTFNEQMFPNKKIQYYFYLSSSFAGNAFSLAKAITGQRVSSENPSHIAGSPYSQFAKLSIDARGYYNFKNKNKIALRIFAGAAKAYGNASTLPYSKQFFSGGPNSIRAFSINSVGPGNYNQNNIANGLLHLGGDVKCEANAEYRFNIYSFFKGAVFADAGNVWLLKSNPAQTGNPFSLSEFSNELAIGTGIGLRIDVSFFILRFDLAMPLRKPWLTENNSWVTHQIDFGSPAWRSENLIFNVAIGYPF